MKRINVDTGETLSVFSFPHSPRWQSWGNVPSLITGSRGTAWMMTEYDALNCHSVLTKRVIDFDSVGHFIIHGGKQQFNQASDRTHVWTWRVFRVSSLSVNRLVLLKVMGGWQVALTNICWCWDIVCFSFKPFPLCSQSLSTNRNDGGRFYSASGAKSGDLTPLCNLPFAAICCERFVSFVCVFSGEGRVWNNQTNHL